MLSAETVSAWKGVLERVERKTTAQQFATWFRNLKLSEVTNEKVVMAVPSTFHRDWISSYYQEVLEMAVEEEFESRRDVELVVASRDQAGLSVPKAPVATKAAPSQSPSSAQRGSAPAKRRGGFENLLTEGYDFDHFVEGAANQLVKAAGLSLSRGTQSDFSSMLVVGGTGLGKTHALQAICCDALAQSALTPNKGRKVAYIRAEAFVNDFVQALADGDCPRFRDNYRSLDFVCFDDLQVLSGKSHSQQEFLHTFTAWMDRGAKVVVAARCAPGEPLDVDALLLQQLSAAFRVTLRQPDVELRYGIVKAKGRGRGEELPGEVTEFLADLPVSNIRELEGAVTSVIASTRLTGVGLSLKSARAALQDDALVQRPTASPERITNTVCKHFEVKPSDLVSSRRPQALSFARQVAMYLLRERTALSLSEIGELLGGRDHTTILHGIRKVEATLEKDARLQEHLSRLRTILDHY